VCNVTPACAKPRLQKFAEGRRSGEVRHFGAEAWTCPGALSGTQEEIEPFLAFFDKQFRTFVKTISHFKGAGFLQMDVLKPAIY